MTPVLESVFRDVQRIALRTPTLPPATATNTYLLGAGARFVIVEPATPYDDARKALFAAIESHRATGAEPVAIVLTHHHVDHVGASDAVRARYAVPVLAHAVTREKLQGRVTTDGSLAEGDTLLDGALHVICTPGHAPGHLCLHDTAKRWLVAGDMVASVGTIIVDPDDGGDMGEYLASLERLASLAPRVLLPAHGDPVDDPRALLAHYTAHRLAREARVLDAIAFDRVTVLADCVAGSYADTPVHLWALAAKSARAHLARLVALGRVVVAGDGWQRV